MSSYSDITTVFSLCGGGIPAVFYGTGILHALNRSDMLVKKINGTNVFNKQLLFAGSSGGIVPLLFFNYVLVNNLHNSRDDWFEHYIVKPIDLIHTNYMVQMYIASLTKSFCIYNGKFSDIIRLCSEIMDKILIDIVPSEILNGKSIVFDSTVCSQINYNYISDSILNDSPEVSNNFDHLNGLSVITQMREIIASCTVSVSCSELKSGIFNDAALLIDNDILNLNQYTNLKNIYYYTLYAYDYVTNKLYNDSSLFTLNDMYIRSSNIHNYRAINNLKLYVSGREGVTFNLVTFPNKYNPIKKYNNKIYNDLVENIFYQRDFFMLIEFLGILNGDSRMLQLMFLVGAFETTYIMNTQIDTVNKITDGLPIVYKQTLSDPCNVYFKPSLLSIFSGLFI